MAYTYRWQDLIVLVSKQVKNIPTQSLDAIHCDLVSTRIASRLPWAPGTTTIAAGQIPLANGQQDYDPPSNIWRLTDASLRCTSITPNDDMTITVRSELPVDLMPVSPYAITSVALQAGAGRLRLSAAVLIPSGTTWELRGTYQINPTKVTSTSQYLWFDDRYVYVAVEGLKYWYMQLADDPRAGSTAGTWPGDITYTGQLAQFMSSLKEMSDAEDIGGDMQAIPDLPLGITYSHAGIYGFGAGGTGGFPASDVPAVPAGTNFADNEIVSGVGRNWTLVHQPYPALSLALYQYISGFGNIQLKLGTDYTVAGTAVTTSNVIGSGALTAYYRW